MIDKYEKMGCRMSLKLHYVHSHLDFFGQNLGDVSEEHGERFHQDIAQMEQRYKGHWGIARIGDYIWSIMRSRKFDHKRKACSNVHFLSSFKI